MSVDRGDDTCNETPGAGIESRERRMSEVKRKAVIGSVFLFVLGVTLVGVTGFSTPGPAEWEAEGAAMAGALFANGRGADVDGAITLPEKSPAPSPSATDQDEGVPSARPAGIAPTTARPAHAADTTAQAADGPAGAKDSFTPVAKDAWAYKAVQDLAADELPSLEEELDGKKPVTRYELAVILARVLEKLQGASKVIEGPLAKVATLEKLANEFRSELDMLGVKGAQFATRLSKVEAHLKDVDGAAQAAKKEAAAATECGKKAEERAEAAAASVEKLERTVASYDEKLATSEQRLRKLSDIMSRLLVKVALNDSRIKDLSPAEAAKDRRDFGTMARAIQGLQKKVDEIENERKTETQRVDTLSRSIDRLAAAPAAPAEAAPAAAGGDADATRVRVLTQLVGRLRMRIDETSASVEELKQQPQTRAAVSPKALSEVKGLLKGFFTEYEQRLGKVERRVM